MRRLLRGKRKQNKVKKRRFQPRFLVNHDLDRSTSSTEKKLTNLQARLVEEYVKDFNGHRAYKAAGGKAEGNAASACATQILNYPHVQKAVREKQREMREQASIDAMDVIRELMRIAFADMKDFASWSSGAVILKPSTQLPNSLSCVVQEITESTTNSGNTSVKIKLHPKIQALKMLGEHLNLFGDATNDDESVEDKAQQIRMAVNDIYSSVPTAPNTTPPKKEGKVVKMRKKDDE